MTNIIIDTGINKFHLMASLNSNSRVSKSFSFAFDVKII
jgi:hypothetical protein